MKTAILRYNRRIVQSAFCMILCVIGYQFYRFITILEAGVIPKFERPPGVEAFLPISALVSLKHTIITHTINTVHPSGLVLFLIICATALVAKKSFCAWVCPVGLLAESLDKLRNHLYLSRLKMPVIPDRMLQCLKYGLLAFFIWSIFFKMPIAAIDQFIHSPFNRFADVKMLKFFTDMSSTALIVILLLLLLSTLLRFFWCRYLCPYGALLGVLSYLSLGKIKRNDTRCTRCGICEKKCMGQIKIRQYKAVTSPECTACLECVTHCPEKKAIGFSFFTALTPVSRTNLAVLIVLIFITGIGVAKSTGHWQNSISKKEYLIHVVQAGSPTNPMQRIDPEKLERMRQMMLQMQKSRVQ